MIANPLGAAKHLGQIPIYCPTCGYATTIPAPDEAVVAGLVARSEEVSWIYEKTMLRRLDALVRQFPDSLHRDKVRVTTTKAGPNNQYRLVMDSRPKESQPIITRKIAPDPEFEAALDANLDLKAWMKHSSFLLYYRLKLFEKEVDYSDEYAIDELLCPGCHLDYVAIERELFERLG